MNHSPSSTPSDGFPAPAKFWRYRLAAKIGAISAGVTTITCLLIGILVPSFSWWMGGLLILVSFCGTYVATVLNASRRLELARGILKNLRKHQFETLDLAQVERGDEINDIIRQVYRTGRVLEREFEELKKVENYRQEFLGNISHELKTPIFSIRGFAETLHEGALEDSSVNRSFVEKIIRNADRLNNLATDLGEIARLEKGELELKMTPFSIKRLVKDVVESVEPQAKERQIELAASFGRKMPDVFGDASQIRQVVVNLVDNAIKYSNDGGHVGIKVSRRGSEAVRCEIRDDGVGIAKDDIERLTERFFRVDKSRSRTAGGTGLGLSIVKHILAAHAIELSVRSKPGKGSTFHFDLAIATALQNEIAPNE